MKPEHLNNREALTLFNQILEDEWETRLAEDPLLATRVGDLRYNDQLPAVRPEDFERRASQLREFRRRLAEIEREGLPAEERLNYDLFAGELNSRLEEFEIGVHLTPISRLGGPQADLGILIETAPFLTVGDYEAYMKRLEGFEAYMVQYGELLRYAIQRGYLPARCTLEGVVDTVRAHATPEAEEHALYKPFKAFPAGMGATEQEQLVKAGKEVISKAVKPAFKKFAQFLEDEYIPAARQTVAAADFPNGKEYYRQRVRRFTTLVLEPEEIHATGLAEVKRIREEMETAQRQAGFKGDFRAYLEYLRKEPRYYVDKPEALMKEVALIMKKMDGELPRLFRRLPRTPYGIREIPDYVAPYTTTAYYFPPNGDGTTAGFYYVNTYDLKSRPLYEYEALSLHEAVPGHHLQLALQIELEGLPNFRRYLDATAFIEGWALYAERLGLEVGFYQEASSNFGRLCFEMWRAARLVVDSGMHALGWIRQQAIDFMAEHTALAMLNIENEVDRYIAWPGQALAYKIGELKIRTLRAEAEQKLSGAFDLREFHEVLLEEGAIPLADLEKRMREWMKGKQDKK